MGNAVQLGIMVAIFIFHSKSLFFFFGTEVQWFPLAQSASLCFNMLGIEIWLYGDYFVELFYKNHYSTIIA